MEHVTQKRRDWRKEEDDTKRALGELSYLMGWASNHPQSAGMLAFEARQIAFRYTQDPYPDSIGLNIRVPLSVWTKYVEVFSIESQDALVVQAMRDAVEKHNRKSEE